MEAVVLTGLYLMPVCIFIFFLSKEGDEVKLALKFSAYGLLSLTVWTFLHVCMLPHTNFFLSLSCILPYLFWFLLTYHMRYEINDAGLACRIYTSVQVFIDAAIHGAVVYTGTFMHVLKFHTTLSYASFFF